MENLREDTKNVTICGRNFIIKKFNALTGSYMLIRIGALVAPIMFSAFGNTNMSNININDIGEIQKNINMKDIDFSKISNTLLNLSESEFRTIQTKCLQVCYEQLPAGQAQVMDINGKFGVMNIERDVKVVMALTVHTLIFNIKDFFGEDLSSLMGGVLSLPQQN
jgi:hypothetical protein